VYRSPSEALEAFRWFDKAGNWDKIFSDWERAVIVYVGAFAMWIIGRRLKKKHQVLNQESIF
jgi:microsomal prostaglandin-E synthase 2